MGAEIWVKVGEPAPIDPKELSFLSVDTSTPYVAGGMLSRDEVAGKYVEMREDMPARAAPVKAWHPA